MNDTTTGRTTYYPLLIIAVGLLAYCTTFHVPFIFDDDFNIVNNPAIRDFTSMFGPAAGRSYPPQRIVGYLTLALNYQLHGLDVAGYHVFNLAVHLGSALLVYLLVRLTFRTPWFTGRQDGTARVDNGLIALFSALIFVAHPVQTQAVTYIIQRLASLATFLYLLALVSYIKARLLQHEHPDGPALKRGAFHLLAFLAALLAMKTKEISFTLPVVTLCYELIFFRGSLARRLAGLLPIMTTIIVIPLTLLQGGRSASGLIGDVGEVTRVMTPVSRLDYLLTQFRVIVTYLRLLVLPVNQQLDYDYPLFHSFFDKEVLASFLLLTALAAVAVLLLVRALRGRTANQGLSRLAAFCILWFFVTLSVESSIVPIADVIFEHRLYLPSIGFCVAVPLVVLFTLGRRGVALLACLVVLLAGAAFKRNMVWGDEVRLWLDNEAKSPDKGRGYTQLGKAYKKIGRDDLTIQCYNRRLARAPADPDAYNNRANAYYRIGRADLAFYDFSRAIMLDPAFALPYFNRGSIYQDRKEYGNALADFLRAQALDPSLERINLSLGYVYEELGQHDRAIEAYTREIALKPGSGEAYFNRAIAYKRKGLLQESADDLRTARGRGVGR